MSPDSTPEFAARIAATLKPALGDGVTVANLRLLTGGASRTTYAFDAVTAAGPQALILRMAPPAEHYAGMELEAAVQAAAAEAGAPVPHILVSSDSLEALGNPFLICGEIAGETIVRRIQRRLDDPGRARLLAQCAQALAAIHRARTDAAGLVGQDQVAQYRQRLDETGDTTATFEWAFRWLDSHRPRPSDPVLVHGDFRMGNLIVDVSATPVNLAAVLDWELVHVGEIYEDLAWFCVRAWRFGAPATMAAGGLGGVDEFLAAYEQAGGRTVDREALHWWLVLATLKWGLICRFQAERHLSGETRSVELAAIGRRVCENEWDLLELLHAPATAPRSGAQEQRQVRAAGPASGLYGRPTAAELVAAVAEFLDDEVRANTAGPVNFHALVAANALRIVERELLGGDAALAGSAISQLGYPDEQALAAAIRAGKLDADQSELVRCLYTVVGARLLVAHPGYASE